MMSLALRAGDRVRVSRRNLVTRYAPGDTGIVRDGPRISSISGVTFYLVSMDRDSHQGNVAFKAHEIEPAEEASP